MNLKVFLIISMLFTLNIASAQDYVAEAKSMKESADLASQKSYTKKNAFTGYLGSFRLYAKAGTKYHDERAELLSATYALMKDERSLMKRDAAVVDSLLNESYEEFRNDVTHYLPLLEMYVCKAAGYEDKYVHSFYLYDRAIAMRKQSGQLNGDEYEVLLRWYVSHLFYKKNITDEDKFNIHKELWDLYLTNNPNPDELDIKLLDSYHTACGMEGHEETEVMLSEIKNKYIIAKFGKDSKEYLKIQKQLAGDYFSLALLEEKKGINADAAAKETEARREVWRILNQDEELYDDNAIFELNSLVRCLNNTSEGKIDARKLAVEYKKKVANKLGIECEQYAKALNIICDTYENDDAEIIPVLKERLALEEKLYGKDDYRTQLTSTLLSSTYSQNHQLSEAIAISQSTQKEGDYLSVLTRATNQSRYGKLRESNETYEELLQLCGTKPEIKGMVGYAAIMGSVNNYITLNDIEGLLDFGKRWSNNPTMSFEDQLTIFTSVIGMASLPGRSSDRVVAFADEFLLSHPQQMSDIKVMTKVLESKASALYGMLRFDETLTVLNQISSILTTLPTISKADIIKYNAYIEATLIAKQDFRQALVMNNRNMEIIHSVPGYETSIEHRSALVRSCLCYDQLGEYSKILPLSNILRSLESKEITALDPLASLEINNFNAFYFLTDINSILTPLIHAYCNAKMYDEASTFLVAYVKDLETTIKFTLKQLNTDQNMGQFSYMKTTADCLNLVAALQQDNSTLAQTVFDYCLLSKQAFLASETQMRRQILESGDSILAQKFQTIQNLRASIQTYIQSGLDASTLQEQLQQLELQIREDSQIYGDFTKAMELRWLDIQSAMDETSAIVEFLSYPDFRDKKNYLAAVVMQKEWTTPRIISLCCEEDLRGDVLNDNTITNLVWAPILNILSNVKTICFSPAGIIYNLSIENSRFEDGYIADKYNLIRISSSREIVNRRTSTGTDATLCGGIVYNMTAEELAASNNNSIGTFSTRYVSRAAIDEIPYLAGTKTEVESIENTLSKHNGISSHLFTAKSAVENCIKGIKPQTTRILHIATHGFFDPDPITESNLIINTIQSGNEDRVLSRSGLYLAGAQNTLDGDAIPDMADDGILTAQEISTLDLRGLDLVTLSACETAKGDITGDGVFGLQRGFKKAGANSILMSLWKVDDEATCKLMTEFYSNWIGKKMTKHDALEAAKKTVRETKGWEDPKYWAAFILLDGLD